MDSSHFAGQEPPSATGRGHHASRPTAKIAEHRIGFNDCGDWNIPLAARSTAEQELAEFREWQALRIDLHLSQTAATALDVPLDVPSILTRDVISDTPWHDYSNGESPERAGSPEPADGGLEEPILCSVTISEDTLVSGMPMRILTRRNPTAD
ncbi:hypothetical protein PHLCEN_2v6900 [Hermanssonia centrifuga]|uniref:Uncharacterized protein n=1 Tax=Hermanssonia centrifuga TaxID=98765 RepID=A0A2R6NYQ4_9APHY|nr:hypothetical protein PHLCEN_2v6900 [Hermanssonia centrifuga]